MATPRGVLDSILEASIAAVVFDVETDATVYQNGRSADLFGPIGDLPALKHILRQDMSDPSSPIRSVRALPTLAGVRSFMVRDFRADDLAIYLLEDVTPLSLELETLRQSTSVDSLTKALNRRAILAMLERQISRAERYGELSWVLLFDLDHFKQVNDTYGHLAGDYVLAKVSALTMDALRKPDRLGRYGGEEFLVILPHTNAAGGYRAAERIRRRVDEYTFTFESRGIGVSLSIGMTGFQAGDTEQSIIGRCDRALYRAKDKGRNRVELQ